MLAVVPLLLWAAAGVTVTGGAVLRDGCTPDDSRLAVLAAGMPAEVRFAVAGYSPTCYKVRLTIDGRPVDGFLPASQLHGLEGFERARASATDRNLPQLLVGVVADLKKDLAATPAEPRQGFEVQIGGDAMTKGLALLENKQPAEALRVFEGVLKTRPRDPSVLALAGVAAYNSDNVKQALSYLKESLDLRPNGGIQQFYNRLQREAAYDTSGDKVYSTRFELRYDGTALNSGAANQLLSTLETEWTRISGLLGCRNEERLTAVIQTRDSYLKSFATAEWSGGFYDGSKVRVALMEGSVGPRTRQALSHELVHACLAGLGNYPIWLHEGLAQKLSGESISPGQRRAIQAAVAARRIPRLSNLGQNWMRLSATHAAMAYQYALAATDVFFEQYQQYGLSSVLHNPALLAQVTAGIEQSLAR